MFTQQAHFLGLIVHVIEILVGIHPVVPQVMEHLLVVLNLHVEIGFEVEILDVVYFCFGVGDVVVDHVDLLQIWPLGLDQGSPVDVVDGTGVESLLLLDFQ